MVGKWKENGRKLEARKDEGRREESRREEDRKRKSRQMSTGYVVIRRVWKINDESDEHNGHKARTHTHTSEYQIY